MGDNCPHCRVRLPLVRDAFCPCCREPLEDPAAPICIPSHPRTDAAVPLWVIQLALAAGVVWGVSASVASAPWEARLEHGHRSWIMDLGRQPTWRSPVAPDYGAFRRHFATSEDFPPPDGAWDIRVSYDPTDVVLRAVVYAWPVAFGCGVFYLAVRGRQRDPVLHLALSAAVGLLIAGASCFALWLVAGGWGPPVPECFAVLGLVGGFARGFASLPTGSGSTRTPPPPACDAVEPRTAPDPAT